MKTRTKEFIQHISHEIENEANAEAYLNESLALIGLVVMYFNALEKSLDSLICEIISDRSDMLGQIVLQKLMFNAKLDLFKRLGEELHQCINFTPSNFNEKIGELSEIAKLRNFVVHADWNSTDDEGYTYIRLKWTKNGALQEYIQFSAESLEKLIDRIVAANQFLADYWEWRSEYLSN